MSATSMGDRTAVQAVIRLVACRRCHARPGQACHKGTQCQGKYVKTVPDSHQVRWRDAIDAGHLPDRLEQLYT